MNMMPPATQKSTHTYTNTQRHNVRTQARALLCQTDGQVPTANFYPRKMNACSTTMAEMHAKLKDQRDFKQTLCIKYHVHRFPLFKYELYSYG